MNDFMRISEAAALIGRTVYCVDCKHTLDRDYNAAINITKNSPLTPLSSEQPGITIVNHHTLLGKPIRVFHRSQSFTTRMTT